MHIPSRATNTEELAHEQALPEVPWVDASGDSPSTQVPNALVTTGQINYYRYDDPADWGLTGY